MSRALLDTSVVVAGIESFALEPGSTAAISVITLGELRAGVLLARDAGTRAGRQTRFAAVRGTFEPLPIDALVAELYGDVLATARMHKRMTKATDLLIIATAAATGRVLLTLDRQQAQLARLADVVAVQG